MSNPDWEVEADVWGKETHEWTAAVEALWWEDWGSTEDAYYDTEEKDDTDTGGDP